MSPHKQSQRNDASDKSQEKLRKTSKLKLLKRFKFWKDDQDTENVDKLKCTNCGSTIKAKAWDIKKHEQRHSSFAASAEKNENTEIKNIESLPQNQLEKIEIVKDAYCQKIKSWTRAKLIAELEEGGFLWFRNSFAKESFENDRGKKEAEVKTATFISENRIAVLLVEKVLRFFKELVKQYPDDFQNIELQRTKCSKIIINVTGKFEFESLKTILRLVNFSLSIDESTDHTNAKFLCIVVQYRDPLTGRVVVQLLNLLKLYSAIDGTAANLYARFKKFMTENCLPIKNIKGFGSDNVGVMVGEHESFFEYLKVDSSDAIKMNCVCHTIALVAGASCKKLPKNEETKQSLFKECELLIRSISTYLNASPKRLGKLQELQEFLDLKLLKILKLAETRWLSLLQCIDQIVYLWNALVLFFTNECFDEKMKNPKKPELVGKAEVIYSLLIDPTVQCFLHFLRYNLYFYCEYNVFFQSKEVLTHKLALYTLNLMRSIGKHILVEGVFNEPLNVDLNDINNYKDLWSISLRQESNKLLKNVPLEKRKFVRESAYTFYKVGMEEMKKRFSKNIKFWHLLTCLGPSIALTEKNQEFPITKFKEFFPYINYTHLFLEWHTLPKTFTQKEKDKFLAEEMKVEEFWHAATSKQVNSYHKYPNLKKLIDILLCLPHSNCECERVFSITKEVKDQKRSNMSPELLNSICIVRSAFKAKNICSATYKITEDHLRLLKSKNLYGPKKKIEKKYQNETEDNNVTKTSNESVPKKIKTKRNVPKKFQVLKKRKLVLPKSIKGNEKKI